MANQAGKRRTIVAVALLLVMFETVLADSGPRTFATQAQCERGRGLPSSACKTAFANVQTEFEAKTPRFSTRRQCYRQFGPCMPWPPGTQRIHEFRPQWLGISVDTRSPTVMAAPWVAPGKLNLSFAPQSVSVLSPAVSNAEPVDSEPPVHAVSRRHERDGEDAGPMSPPPPPGSGFTMIDGVLTYPAPARFQPKALRRP